MKLLLLLSHLFLFPAMPAQDTVKIKELISNVNKAGTEREKALNLYELSTEYRDSDPKKAVTYGKRAAALAKLTDDKKLLANAESATGSGYYNLGNYDNALTYFLASLRLREEIQDSSGISSSYNNIANIYNSRGDYEQALTSYKKALEIGYFIKDTLGNSITSINIGNIYLGEKDFDKALSYYQNSLPIVEKTGKKDLIVICYINMGLAYTGKKNYDLAIRYYNLALPLADEIGSLIDKIYALRGKAEAHLEAKRFEKALVNAKESLKLALRSNGKDEIRLSASVVNDIYEQMGDYAKAHEYLTLYAVYNDSITNEQVTDKIAEAQVKYETEKKAKANLQLVTEHQLHSEEQQRKQTFQYLTVALFVLVCAVAIVFLRGRIRLRAIHKALTEKNYAISLVNKELNSQQKVLTEQAELLKKQKSELERLNGVKDRLFSVIAHDLRGPLVSLKGLLQVMSMGGISEEKQAELFKSLVKGQQNVLWMLDNLFDWARAQMKGFEVEKLAIDVRYFTEENIRLLLPTANSKDIRIENRIPEETLVQADKEMIKLVLRNLISNAIKFCSAGDLIVVSAFLLDDICTITVQDTGVGISEHVQKKLFNQSGYTSRGTENEKGSGLGLALCKDFVEQNGGRIWVESTLGEGSAFKFTLPASPKVDSPEKAIQDLTLEAV